MVDVPDFVIAFILFTYLIVGVYIIGRISYWWYIIRSNAQQAERKSSNLIIGVIFGIIGGLFSNIFVVALYRIIDNNSNGNNELTFYFGLFGLAIFLLLLYILIRRNIPE